MKKSLLYFWGLIVAVIMSACAMTNEVHFNKNYSGTYALNVDFSDMVDMAKSFDPSMEDASELGMVDQAVSVEEREEMKQMINQIDGISNTSFEVIEKSRLEFKFDFEDIETLNSAFSEIQAALSEQRPGMDGVGSLGLPQFTKDGKVISHSASFPSDQIPKETMDEFNALGDGDGMVDMMMGMMDYTVVLSFDRKIKSVEIDGVDLISQDKHIVKARIDLSKMIDGGAYHIDVKTK